MPRLDLGMAWSVAMVEAIDYLRYEKTQREPITIYYVITENQYDKANEESEKILPEDTY